LEKIDALVLQHWAGGAVSFHELVSELPGVYPSEVLCALRRLRKASQMSEFDVLAIELEVASTPPYRRIVEPIKRYIEHPLDFEWRFTQQGVARICEEIQRFPLKPNAEILCLGCPSVYVFGSQSLRNLKFTLWDKNSPVNGQMEEVKVIDLSEMTTPRWKADFAVIDPPWYNEFYQLFIWAAFHCLPLGGRILLSFPPEGTRPSVIRERDALIDWCSSHGLKLEKRKPHCLSYRSPLFEVNALRQQGITNFPLNWRKGDLIVLKKQRGACFSKPSIPILDDKWEEIRVGSSRIRVCRGRKCGDALLAPVGPTEILPSVSSRHRLRKFANVITSGNRFLRTRAPENLLACLSIIKESDSANMINSFFASQNPLLLRKATELICKEEKEAAQYFRLIHEF
jgi:hypothetical protein